MDCIAMADEFSDARMLSHLAPLTGNYPEGSNYDLLLEILHAILFTWS